MLNVPESQAEAFIAALRQSEDSERAERLTRLTAGAEDEAAAAADAKSAPTEIARLQAQVEMLAQFRTAVLSSKAWSFIQAVRRPFGRAW
jgi:hypothetical protein